MAEWPEYESIKIVLHAMPITGITPEGVLLVGPDHEPFKLEVPTIAKYAQIGGYAIEYADGYRSFLPKNAFDEAYRRIT